MDRPDLDRSLHWQALRALVRVNRLSGTARSVWGPVARLAAESRRRPLRVVDVACGAGDVALWLSDRARRKRLPLSLSACDISPAAVEFARDRARRQNLDVDFFVHDAVESPLPDEYDVVVCTLFLHHLTTDAAERFLGHLAAAARQLVVINDLRRSRLGYFMARYVVRALTRSPVVHFDGPASVGAAFRIDEVRALADRCGLRGAQIAPIWPQRFLLTWRHTP